MPRWKRESSWWDDLAVPADVIKNKEVFKWLARVAPAPEEHDYVIYTDGSGCKNGWGAQAAIILPVAYDADKEERYLDYDNTMARMKATYGSTVQRCEMEAFLDGVHSVLLREAEIVSNGASEEDAFNISQTGLLNYMADRDKISVLWYTDRRNLASSLLFDEDDVILNKRSKEIDLWMRYSSMARNFCITPMAVPRNTVPQQADCDSLCSTLRNMMLAKCQHLEEHYKHIYPPEKWMKPKNQKAIF